MAEVDAEVKASSSGGVQSSPEKWGTLPEDQVFYAEAALGMLCLLYLVCVGWGWWRNRALARKLEKVLKGIAEPQFAQLGMSPSDPSMLVDGMSTFIFYATGRKNIKSMTVHVDLCQRQDLFAMARDVVMGSAGDRIRILLPLSVPMEPIIFSVVRRKEVKRFRETHEDVEQYVTSEPWPSSSTVAPPQTLEVLAESADVVQALMPPSALKLMAAGEKYIVSLHITDRGVTDDQSHGEPRMVVLELMVPSSSEEMTIIENLIKMSLSYCDRLPNLTLTASARESIRQHRQTIDNLINKEREKEMQEEAQRKKTEKKRKEKEEVTTRSREAQRKYEEKETRREAKKRMRSMVKVSKF